MWWSGGSKLVALESRTFYGCLYQQYWDSIVYTRATHMGARHWRYQHLAGTCSKGWSFLYGWVTNMSKSFLYLSVGCAVLRGYAKGTTLGFMKQFRSTQLVKLIGKSTRRQVPMMDKMDYKIYWTFTNRAGIRSITSKT